MNLPRRKPLVLPIVPLHQIALDMGTVAESRQLAGLACAVERAGQDESERFFGENRPQKSGSRAPIVRERNIRHAGMLPAQAPLGFPVAHQITLLLFPCHGSMFPGAFVYSLDLKDPPSYIPRSGGGETRGGLAFRWRNTRHKCAQTKKTRRQRSALL